MACTPGTASAGVPGVVVTPNQCRNLLLPEITSCRATIEQQHLPCFDHGVARILLIEDDEDVRELIGQMLEDAGYSVSSAVDG